MPARTSTPVGAPCWVDLTSSDADRARAFYAALFGWTVTDGDPELGGYAQFLRDGVPVAGLMGAVPGQPADLWSVHLATDDAQKTLDAAAAEGGQVVVPAERVADLGTMSVLLDPTGAAVGAWQAGSFGGFGVVTEPGAPSWFELHTRDHDAAVAFYRSVFRWDTHVVSDSDELRYTVLRHGDAWLAGVADAAAWLPGGAPSHWVVYLGVADADAACARAVELGGTVLSPPEDTEYGRVAALADPAGAPFRVVAENSAMPAPGTAGAPGAGA